MLLPTVSNGSTPLQDKVTPFSATVVKVDVIAVALSPVTTMMYTLNSTNSLLMSSATPLSVTKMPFGRDHSISLPSAVHVKVTFSIGQAITGLKENCAVKTLIKFNVFEI